MHISHETSGQTQLRLGRVLSAAEFVVRPGLFTFVEVSVEHFPVHLVTAALAFVRDEQVWSALIPSENDRDERYAVFSFHFIDGQDNSGFVGWLATHLKRVLGTGVFVACGYNAARGGIHDYWGVPAEVAPQAIAEIERMRDDARSVRFDGG